MLGVQNSRQGLGRRIGCTKIKEAYMFGSMALGTKRSVKNTNMFKEIRCTLGFPASVSQGPNSILQGFSKGPFQ